MPDEMFTTVRRGYDPAEVERAIGQAQAEAADLRSRLQAAEADAQQARSEADHLPRGAGLPRVAGGRAADVRPPR